VSGDARQLLDGTVQLLIAGCELWSVGSFALLLALAGIACDGAAFARPAQLVALVACCASLAAGLGARWGCRRLLLRLRHARVEPRGFDVLPPAQD
jgi:hypothetical protein